MGKPLVAIVGRPNVGKSTLFNKIAGKRIAIVEDTPGVTRDRIYAEAEWLTNTFSIVDTGGIEPESEDIIFSQMRRQAQVAIETAQVIIFLVDGKQGLTDADKEVATMLRKSRKPVVLVVNKIDSWKSEDAVYEFYNLGLGDPISISAKNMLAIGDLLDEVVSHFPEAHTKEDDEDDSVKIAFVGRPNVGKSSLINKLLGEERLIVSDIPGTTRDSIDSIIESDIGKFTLIDTAGLRRKSKIKEDLEHYSVVRTLSSIEKADVCILMLDATEQIADQDEKIIGYAHELGKAIMVIVNKWDLIEKDTKTMDEYKNNLSKALSFMSYAPFLFISAKTGQRVHKVLELAKKCYESYTRRIATGVLNEVVNKAILMKEPPVITTKRLKIFYVTQISVKPPTFLFFVNAKNALHFSYQRYLENQIRNSFDFEGTAIKTEFKERDE